MPAFEVSAPDGRKFRIEGDKPPTEDDLDQIFQSSARRNGADATTALGAFTQMHPEIVQGPRLSQVDSLVPALPQAEPQEPRLPVPSLSQYQPQPRNLDTVLREVGEPLQQ